MVPNVHERSRARISKMGVYSELADVKIEGVRMYESWCFVVETTRLIVQQKSIATVSEDIIK